MFVPRALQRPETYTTFVTGAPQGGDRWNTAHPLRSQHERILLGERRPASYMASCPPTGIVCNLFYKPVDRQQILEVANISYT